MAVLSKTPLLRSAVLAAGFALVPAAAFAASAALAAGTTSAPRDSVAHAAHAPATPEPFYHLKYADSLSSVNDRCVVTHNRLNPAMHPLYVNGSPVGFC
jgi:hypothetical protein